MCDYDPKKVVTYLVKQLKRFQNKQFKTIYLGGGTPNALDNNDLNYLLSHLKPLTNNRCEFTIECNPDLVTENQIKVMKINKVNRISLGVQSTNNRILRLLNRLHSIETCYTAISLLQKHGFKNISVDFIYALPLMKVSDVNDAIEFVVKNHLTHISFYGLDLKPGSMLTKQNYQINQDDEADQLEAAIIGLAKNGYERYEVSNWAINKKYRSQHNLAYWYTKDWAAVGYGAHGLEKRISYEYINSINKPIKRSRKMNPKKYFLQILIMGLRLLEGIDISIEPYKSAYNYYKDKLKFVHIKNKKLVCDNINLLNNSIIDLFE